ncbi:MAG: ABC transporter ATP-binding protein [Nocardioidaceae bacterium]
MTAAVPLVRCDAVSRTYGAGNTAVVAVHTATCEVPAKARIAIVGPSGSGKSTLLYLMAGLDAPTSGRVSWPALGDKHQPHRAKVGMVFQGASLMSPLTVVENVALPLVLEGAPDKRAQERAHQALVTLGIEELANKLPEELSGGQAQRAAVARALAAGRPLIIADEPTGQLDHVAADRVMSVLLSAADSLDATLLVSTHDPLIADRLDTRWTMDEGTLHTVAGFLEESGATS